MICPHTTCGHEWIPRKENPKKCPQCQNPLWRSSRPKKQRVVSDDKEPAINSRAPQVLDAEPGKPLAGEKDSLSQAKARAEELMRMLTV